jgi:hypothetical protein
MKVRAKLFNANGIDIGFAEVEDDVGVIVLTGETPRVFRYRDERKLTIAPCFEEVSCAWINPKP